MKLATIFHAAYRPVAFSFYVCTMPYRILWRAPKYFASMFWELLSRWVRSYSIRMLKNIAKDRQNSKPQLAGNATYYDTNFLSMCINIHLILPRALLNLSYASPFALISWLIQFAHLTFISFLLKIFGPLEEPKTMKTKEVVSMEWDKNTNTRLFQLEFDRRNVRSKEGMAAITKGDDPSASGGFVIDQPSTGTVEFFTDSEEEEEEIDSEWSFSNPPYQESFGTCPYTKGEFSHSQIAAEMYDGINTVEGSPVWQVGRPEGEISTVVGTSAGSVLGEDINYMLELPTSTHDSAYGCTSAEETEDENEESSTSEDDAENVQPPDFKETMQTVLELEIYQLKNKLERLNCAVVRLHTMETDPLDRLFDGLPVTAEFEDYRQLISKKTQDGLSLVHVRENDLQDWGIENSHHRNLLADRIQQYAEESKTDYLEELFNTFMPTPTFRSYQQAFRDHKVTENELQWIDDRALRAFRVESQVHREMIMQRVEEFIDERNFLRLLFKRLPQSHDFRFYHMILKQHGVTERNISKLSNKDLITMGIVNEIHRNILLRYIAEDTGAVRELLHQCDEEEESSLEDTDSLGSNFMDEAYHASKTSCASSDEFYDLNPPPTIYWANTD